MITTTLSVPKQVRENVEKYFAGSVGLINHEPVAIGQHRGSEPNIYVVLAKQVHGGKWAVWTCWNEEKQTLYHGHTGLTECDAMRLFLNIGNLPEEV